jgi:hypothetical protein
MTLDENDYLTYQLYTASKTPRIKNARIRGWAMTTVTFLGLAYLFFRNNNEVLGYYFLVASGLSLAFYPLYSRWRYKQHYKRYILDTYKNRFGEECTLQIDENFIVTKDKTGEAKINTSEIEEINEIKDFYFVKVKSGVSLIISKSKTNAKDLDALVNSFRDLARKKEIKHNVELDWRWR